MRTIDINGFEFELIKPRKYKRYFEDVNRMINNYTSRDIWDCYSRPSYIKEHIFRVWKNWEYSSNGENSKYAISNIEVSSYNSMQFTLSGIAWSKEDDGKIYILAISRDHNRAIEVSR